MSTGCSSKRFGQMAMILAASMASGPLLADSNVLNFSTIDDKIRGGLTGKYAGNSYGHVLEFMYTSVVPDTDSRLDPIQAGTYDVNYSNNDDDIYTLVPFIDTLNNKGPTATSADYGNYFKADTQSMNMWHANAQARTNLNAGIPSPASGNYKNNLHSADIGGLFESSWAGLASPGMPQAATDAAWRGMHTISYGDAACAAVSVANMHAAAFTKSRFRDVINAGINCVPAGTGYGDCMRAVAASYDSGKTWQQTWDMVTTNYAGPERCPDFGVPTDPKNIEARLNGAYMMMGLLYGMDATGKPDFYSTLKLTCKAGQDTDCTTGVAGAIAGTFLGESGIPAQFKTGTSGPLNRTNKINVTNYTYNDLIAALEKTAKTSLKLQGGTIANEGTGSETWTLPAASAVTVIKEQWPTNKAGKYDNSAAYPAASTLTASIKAQAGAVVTFTASAAPGEGGSIAGYQWFFGDTTVSDVLATGDVTHTYRQVGTYQAMAYTTDGLGDTSYQPVIVNVTSVPEPAALAVLGLGALGLMRRRH